MPWMAVAASVGGSLVSGLMSKKSAGDAVGMQQQGTDQAIGELRSMQDATTRANDQQYEDSIRANDQNYNDSQRTIASYLQTGDVGRAKLEYGLKGGVEEAARKILAIFPTWSATGQEGNPGTAQEIVDSFIKHAPQIAAQGGEQFGYEGYGDATRALLRELQPDIALAQNVPDLLRKFTAQDLENDPVHKAGFQFGLDRGTKQIQQNAARRGSLNSGDTIKAMTQFGVDYAGTKAGESYNRFMGDKRSVYDMLYGTTALGQNAAGTAINAGNVRTAANAAAGNTRTMANSGLAGNVANSIASLYSGMGNARGAASIAGGNAIGGAFTNAGNAITGQMTLDKILNRGGGVVTGGGRDW